MHGHIYTNTILSLIWWLHTAIIPDKLLFLESHPFPLTQCWTKWSVYQQREVIFWQLMSLLRPSELSEVACVWLPIRKQDQYSTLGRFRINGSKNTILKINQLFSDFVACIPVPWKYLMEANFPGVDFLGTVLKFRRRKKIWSSLVYIHTYIHTYALFNLDLK